MTGDLYGVLASVGMRSSEDADQYFVDDLVLRYYPSEMDGVGRVGHYIACALEDMRKNLKRLRA
jgi:hypothetical protein